MKTKLLGVTPVLPSQDIDRDIAWYEKHVGFRLMYKDSMYAVMFRESICLHLQWHADTEDDPLLGGSVMKIFVDNIEPIFKEFVERQTVKQDKLTHNTPWGTHEFGFYDLNNNAVFIVQDV